MCRRVWACPCVCVCRSSSVNIVLCSSNSSSSGSAVAACSTVCFPSWRTTSYQISRHCLLACCPTTRSRRISRPLSSRLPIQWNLLLYMMTESFTLLQVSFIGIDNDCNNLCSKVFIYRADVTDETVLSPCRHGSPLSCDREIRADSGPNNGSLYESIWVWRVSADTWVN